VTVVTVVVRGYVRARRCTPTVVLSVECDVMTRDFSDVS